MSGMAGFSRMREVPRIGAVFFVCAEGRAPGVHVWTPVGLQTRGLGRADVCNSLRNLVGPPRFELGTSCTPSKKYQSITYRQSSLKTKDFWWCDLDAKWTPRAELGDLDSKWTPLHGRPGLDQVTLTCPGRETRARKGPGTSLSNWEIRGSAVRKTAADLTPAKIAGSEDEYPGAACAQRSNLQRTVSQPLILGQHHPATFSDRLEPDAVFRVTSEMIIVNLDHETGLDEFRSEWFYAQRPIDKEDGLVRRLHSGWLLRSHRSPNGSPARGPQWNRPPCTARRWMKPVYPYRRLSGGQTKLPDS